MVVGVTNKTFLKMGRTSDLSFSYGRRGYHYAYWVGERDIERKGLDSCSESLYCSSRAARHSLSHDFCFFMMRV